MADIKPFTISIPDSALADLKSRLTSPSLPHNDLEDSDWHYGVPLPTIQRLTTHWRDHYSWRTHEAHLNTLPHFTTTIQATNFEPLTIHFLHYRSPLPTAIPLIFIHGWPGSFVESLKILHPLTHPTNPSTHPAFHVVVPSLPNFAFSTGSQLKGFALAQYAETCHKLMLRLSYNQYVSSGGDWGYFISRTMAIHYPQHLRATHLTMDHGNPPTFLKNPLLFLKHWSRPYTPSELAGFARNTWFLEQGTGYRHLQSTKPQTLGYALAASPVALLAWIVEKLHDWTDGYQWTDDEICTWVSVYWFSVAGPAANVRIYYEAVHDWGKDPKRVTRERTKEWVGDGVKVGLSHSPREISVLPGTWTGTQGEVVFERWWRKGGHFMAVENSEGLVGDLREMFGRKGGAEGVIKGASGYEQAKL